METTTEMTYRTVTVTARVYSGSDDHATWQVFWALDRGMDEPYVIQQIGVENNE